jgi:hypothetical protein
MTGVGQKRPIIAVRIVAGVSLTATYRVPRVRMTGGNLHTRLLQTASGQGVL